MGINFPASPLVGDIWPNPAVAGQGQYTWDGEKWTSGMLSGTPNPNGVIAIKVFTVSGTYVPSANMTTCVVECVGGGGGGGGVTGAASSFRAGGAGGGGTYSEKTLTATAVGAGLTVTVGSAGAAGTATAFGGDGGTSSVGSFCTAPGGGGGQHYNGTTGFGIGGNSGAIGTGDFSCSGQDGQNGMSGALAFGGTGGGAGGIGGGGGRGGLGSGTAVLGTAGRNPGGGGGGAAVGDTSSSVGSAGAPGVVIITEYGLTSLGSSTAAQGTVRYDLPQTLTQETPPSTAVSQRAQARMNVYAAPFDAMAYSGMQINGSMDVSQESGTNAVVVANIAKYVADGFYLAVLGSSASASGLQVAITSLPGYSNCLLMRCTAANPLSGTGDGQWLFQPIEGYRWSRLSFGNATNAQPVTIGFWIWPNITGTMAVSIRNKAQNRSYVVDVPVANIGWQFKTVTIPGCPDGAWIIGNDVGAYVTFSFGGGSGLKGVANTWLTTNANATAATTNFFAATGDIYFTGVVVLPGIEAPSAARSPLIMRPYDQELVTCMRYLETWQATGDFSMIGMGVAGTPTLAYIHYPYKVKKRASASLLYTALSDFQVGYAGLTAATPVTAFSVPHANADSMVIQANTAAVLTPKEFTDLSAIASTTPRISFSARL